MKFSSDIAFLPLHARGVTTPANPCTGAQRRYFLRGIRRGQPDGAHVHSRCFKHGLSHGLLPAGRPAQSGYNKPQSGALRGTGLSTDEPGRIQAKTAIVAEVERLHWRVWNGKARNARRTLERIGKVMHVFKGERGHRTTGVPSRKLWHALREVDNYLRSQSTRLVNYAERYRAGLRVGADLSEWRSDPLRWHRLAPRSAIGDHMPKVTVYKVKLLQRDNG